MIALRQHWRGTILFALLSGADLTLTCHLVGRPAAGFYEANGLAASILDGYGFTGLAVFKAVLVLLTATLVVLVARYRPAAARRLGAFACAAVGLVVLYSAMLWGRAALFAAPGERQATLAMERQGKALDELAGRRKTSRAAQEHWERELAAGRCTLPAAVAGLSAIPEARHIAACVAWYRAEGQSPTAGEDMAALLVHGALDLLTKDGSRTASERGEQLLAAYRNGYGSALLAYVTDVPTRRPGLLPEAGREAPPLAARPARRQSRPCFAGAFGGRPGFARAHHPHARGGPRGWCYGASRRQAAVGSPLRLRTGPFGGVGFCGRGV